MQRNFHTIFGGVIWVYVIIRAGLVGITYDEAWTISDFVPQGWWDVITYTSLDANNHLLNTLLIKIVHLLHGKTLFWERLPNVLAGLTYIYCAYRISVSFLSKYYGYMLFILLLINPFLLDFFGLARGYGLALAFQIGAVYYLFLFAKKKMQRLAFFSLAMGGLAVLSNFSFLTFFIALLLCLCTVYFTIARDEKPVFFLLKSASICLLLLFIVYRPLEKLKEGGMLYYGGTSGFYADTLSSLAAHSVYEAYDTTIGETYLIVFLLGFGLILFIALREMLYRRPLKLSLPMLALLLLLLPVLGIVMQAYMLKGLFPHDRAVMYLLPLAFIALAFIADSVQTKVLQYASKGALTMVVLMYMLNFAAHANSYKTVTWYFDAHTKTVLEELEGFARQERTTIQLSSSWPLKQSIGYYLKKQKDSPVQYQDQLNGRTDAATDFYLYLDNPLKIVEYNPAGEGIHQVGKDTVLAFPAEGIYLFSIRQPDIFQTGH